MDQNLNVPSKAEEAMFPLARRQIEVTHSVCPFRVISQWKSFEGSRIFIVVSVEQVAILLSGRRSILEMESS